MVRKKTVSKKDNSMYQLIFGEEPPAPPAVGVKGRAEEKPISVSELTELIKSAIKRGVPGTVMVAGEISNFVQAGSGHVYFTLKDNQAQISCALWRSNAARVKFKIADGLAVIVQGSVDVYGPRGQYQLYVDRVSPYGMGELELAFRQLKEKLEKEGLFDPDHKKPIPSFPLTIAVVTSPTGAAIRDVLRTLQLRWPVGRVLIYPVQVQGAGAGPQIAGALNDLNRNAGGLKIDVILLVRGGGSLEDLWAFNEEVVARAIFGSTLPIISGVGHEVDITIADLVADHRAATPTAAAEAATPVLAEILETVQDNYLRLRNGMNRTLTVEKGRLGRLADRGMFRHPIVLLGAFARRFDETAQRLGTAMNQVASLSRRRVHETELNLQRISPRLLLVKSSSGVSALESKLHTLAGNYFTKKAMVLDHLEARLNGCDYRKILGRGFAIARRQKDSKILTSIGDVAGNELIVTELADGKFVSEVKEKEGPGV
jgi:exodeoxyribonuclease VII large subunit